MPRDDPILLSGTLRAARDETSLRAGMSEGEVMEDRQAQLSILKSLEIFGEAAGLVKSGTKRAYAAITWREIVGGIRQ